MRGGFSEGYEWDLEAQSLDVFSSTCMGRDEAYNLFVFMCLTREAESFGLHLCYRMRSKGVSSGLRKA